MQPPSDQNLELMEMCTGGNLITKLKYFGIMFGLLKSERPAFLLGDDRDGHPAFGEPESRQLLYLRAAMWKAAGAQINMV